MKWCDHTHSVEGYGVEFRFDLGREGIIWKENHDINFCPTCGIKKPEPVRLKEKFERFYRNIPMRDVHTDFYYRSLEEIAEQHFRENPLK